MLRLPLLAALVLAGCSGGDPIVRLGAQEFVQRDFDRFLETRAGFAPSPGSEVRSALLDEFIRERLLVLGARDAGFTVSETEVRFEIAALDRAEPATPHPAGLRDEIRNRLLAQRFLEEGVLQDLEVTEEDMALEWEVSGPLYRRPATITLSEGRFGTREEAERGAAAVEFHPVGVFREGELPEAVEAAVRPLEIGESTGVLETPNGFRIFRLDARAEGGGAVDPEEAAPVVRRSILERRADERMADLLADLRRRYPVTVFSGRLAFPYLGREPVAPS